MHISEGVLPGSFLIGGWCFSGFFLLLSLKRVSAEKLPRLALLSSLFFLISLIHIPLGPTSTHLTLNGLLAILLGLEIFPAIFIALLFQALFFQYGGLTVLGINTLTMALPPYLLVLFFKKFLKYNSTVFKLISFLIGSLSILLSGFLMALILWLANPKYYFLSTAFVISYLPLSLVEGIITVFVLSYLKKIKKEELICCQ
ncbi:MAG: cobalt transporter CbiM [Caldimicrobium sp.]